jgi:hypothetical protein
LNESRKRRIRRRKMKARISISALVALAMLSLAASASAGIPQMINYQGVLTDSDGCSRDGDFEMVFRVCGTPTGEPEFWSETHSSVTATQGNFTVLLGSINPIPDSLFLTDSLWLEIKVNGEVMAPRQQIASVGYAFRSEHADTAEFAYVGSDNPWSFSGNDICRIDGRVGIGTCSPSAKLEVDTTKGIAIEGNSHGDTGSKYGAKFEAAGQGDYNIGIRARAGCYGVGCTPASISNIGIWAVDGTGGYETSPPGGDWAGCFTGDVRIAGDLALKGSVKFEYDSTFSIGVGESKTLTHGLGGDASKYIVIMYGKNSYGIHQAHYGTEYGKWGLTAVWAGCQWYQLNSSTITVIRADGDDEPSADQRWDQVILRILKNQ